MDHVRLAELCAATSLFTDLGTGQPAEHGLRTCLVGIRLAGALGGDEALRREVFYVTLLRFLGCTADAHQVAELAGGDDMGFLAGMAPATMGSPRGEIARMIRLVAQGDPLPRRLRRLAGALADPKAKGRLLEAHCEVASRLAEEMGLFPGVSDALAAGYARWDGRGVPQDVAGEAIPVSMRVAIVARDIELWGRETDPDTTEEMLRTRRGRAYAPAVVDAALTIGIERLRRCDEDLWDVVLALEPSPWMEVGGPEIRRALTALGDFADLKAPEFSGHARRVARIAAAAANVRNLDGVEAETLVRAALVHDLGVVAVPTGVWRAPRPLNPGEWEQVRLHSLWSDRILRRCSGLEQVAAVAGRHHERLDGSGYPAAIAGDALGAADGLLACADLFDERTSPRPYRPAQDAGAVAGDMARMAGEGALARRDTEAVLGAVGVRVPLVVVDRPAGLTEREIDVLVLLAHGSTNRQIADVLGITAKTVGAHVEHIYAKAGVRSRAAATLFAMRHHLVG